MTYREKRMEELTMYQIFMAHEVCIRQMRHSIFIGLKNQLSIGDIQSGPMDPLSKKHQ